MSVSLRISDLPGLSIRRPTLIVVVNLLIVIAGLSALFAVEVRELPDVDRPVVMVRAFFDGSSPEAMDAEVTSVIEGAVARVSGVKAINSASRKITPESALSSHPMSSSTSPPMTCAKPSPGSRAVYPMGSRT